MVQKIRRSPVDMAKNTILTGRLIRLRWLAGFLNHQQYDMVYVGCGPLTVTVTTRIITFLVGDPYKPSFPTVTVRGPHPRYMGMLRTCLSQHLKRYVLFGYAGLLCRWWLKRIKKCLYSMHQHPNIIIHLHLHIQ